MQYAVEQQPDGRWYIAHGTDPDRAWAGSHWAYRDQTNGVLITSFATEAQAAHYAQTILGEDR